jgi:hypothetical protein
VSKPVAETYGYSAGWTAFAILLSLGVIVLIGLNSAQIYKGGQIEDKINQNVQNSLAGAMAKMDFFQDVLSTAMSKYEVLKTKMCDVSLLYDDSFVRVEIDEVGVWMDGDTPKVSFITTNGNITSLLGGFALGKPCGAVTGFTPDDVNLKMDAYRFVGIVEAPCPEVEAGVRSPFFSNGGHVSWAPMPPSPPTPSPTPTPAPTPTPTSSPTPTPSPTPGMPPSPPPIGSPSELCYELRTETCAESYVMGGELTCPSPLYIFFEEVDSFCLSSSHGAPAHAGTAENGVNSFYSALIKTPVSVHAELCAFEDSEFTEPAPPPVYPCPLEGDYWCTACDTAHEPNTPLQVVESCEAVCEELDLCWWKENAKIPVYHPSAACAEFENAFNALEEDTKSALAEFAAAVDSSTDPSIRSSVAFRCLRKGGLLDAFDKACCTCAVGAQSITVSYTVSGAVECEALCRAEVGTDGCVPTTSAASSFYAHTANDACDMCYVPSLTPV